MKNKINKQIKKELLIEFGFLFEILSFILCGYFLLINFVYSLILFTHGLIWAGIVGNKIKQIGMEHGN